VNAECRVAGVLGGKRPQTLIMLPTRPKPS
jgi:hypothetical protein